MFPFAKGSNAVSKRATHSFRRSMSPECRVWDMGMDRNRDRDRVRVGVRVGVRVRVRVRVRDMGT